MALILPHKLCTGFSKHDIGLPCWFLARCSSWYCTFVLDEIVKTLEPKQLLHCLEEPDRDLACVFPHWSNISIYHGLQNSESAITRCGKLLRHMVGFKGAEHRSDSFL